MYSKTNIVVDRRLQELFSSRKNTKSLAKSLFTIKIIL